MAKAFKSIPTAALMAEIQRRHHLLPKLRKRREKLAAELEGLDEQIAALDGLPSAPGARRRGPGRPPKATGGRRRRARNKVSLADALADVIPSDAPMTIGEILDAVQKRGYKSRSRQFRNIVAQRLAADKRFKRVGRGQYVRAA